MTIELSLFNVQGVASKGFLYEYAPMISAIAAVLSVFAIGFQCWIIYRQTKIMKYQAKISKEANDMTRIIASSDRKTAVRLSLKRWDE